MKLRIELENGETSEQAEELLEKTVKAKMQSRKEYFKTERYADQAIEDFHQMVIDKHRKVIEKIIENVKAEITKDIRGY